jgi:hypothetical protein
MNKLSRLREDLNLKPLKYKESLSSVTFYSKVNIRRKLRPKSSKFSAFVDFDHDFAVDDQGSILQNFVSAETFSDIIPSLNFGLISIQKPQIPKRVSDHFGLNS